MNGLSWTAWKVGKVFSTWHRMREPGYTLCGHVPSGIISQRVTAPAPDQECRTCRWRDMQQHPIGTEDQS